MVRIQHFPCCGLGSIRDLRTENSHKPPGRGMAKINKIFKLRIENCFRNCIVELLNSPLLDRKGQKPLSYCS